MHRGRPSTVRHAQGGKYDIDTLNGSDKFANVTDVLGMTVNPGRPDINIVSSSDYPRAGEDLDVRCEVRGAGGGYTVTWTRVGGQLPEGVITRGDMVR